MSINASGLPLPAKKEHNQENNKLWLASISCHSYSCSRTPLDAFERCQKISSQYDPALSRSARSFQCCYRNTNINENYKLSAMTFYLLRCQYYFL